MNESINKEQMLSGGKRTGGLAGVPVSKHVGYPLLLIVE